MTKKNLFQSGLAFFLCLFLFAGTSFAQTTKTVQVTSSGTWTVPTTLNGNAITVTSVTFEAYGGGGAGGFATGGHWTFDFAVTGGGGGGAYGKKVINDPVAGEAFTITVGASGYNTADDNNNIFDGGCPLACYKNHRQADGGMSSVKRGSTTILEAMGGKTCSGEDNINGAAGGAATGEGDLHYPGGKGGNASYDCGYETGDRSSGSGGGAAGPDGAGGDAANATCSANNGWKAGGTAGGGLAGAGGEGTSDHNDVLGGKPVGNPGLNYGGGGAGSKTYESWHSGGSGAPGVVKITYTYISESIEVENATATICSGTSFDIPLDVTVSGFDLNKAHFSIAATTVTGLTVTNPAITYNTTDNKWHATGTIANSTNGTLEMTLNCTGKTEHEIAPDATFTVKVTVYGKLNGGKIEDDQFVCQNKTFNPIYGDGTAVGEYQTAEGSGGSNSTTYRWYMRDYLNDGDWELIAGANTPNYTPDTNGIFYYAREFVDNTCGTTAFAVDHGGFNFLYTVTVNPVNLDPINFSEDTICSNVNYEKTISWVEWQSPAWEVEGPASFWQKSVDLGATWENVKYVAPDVYSYYDINLTPADFTETNDIWYRVAIKFGDCDSIITNSYHKVHIKEVPDYSDVFGKFTLTMWYGDCDTNIANIGVPVLDPEPFSIVRTDNYTVVGPGTYVIDWSIQPDEDCNIVSVYHDTITVEFPPCGTLEEPLTMTDDNGFEYQTIRIGCDCWFAENLRTNAPDASYYDDDQANESFGKLYNWADAVEVDHEERNTRRGDTFVQGICPDGWAIPTVEQYSKMVAAAEGTDNVKSDDPSTWLPGFAGTNASGFGAKAAGYFEGMQYQRMLGYTYYWTSEVSETDVTKAKVMELRCGCDELMCVEKNKEAKVSVRCVRVDEKFHLE